MHLIEIEVQTLAIPKKTFQSVLKLLSDDLASEILLTLKDSDMYTEQIVKLLKKPKSTISKKLIELEEAGIVESQFVIADVGRRVKIYKFKDLKLYLNSIKDYLNLIDQVKNLK